MKYVIYFCFICFSSQAQIFRSVVYDSTSKKPLAGASVFIRGGNTGIITNNDGYFSIKMKRHETCMVSYIGYVSKVFNAQNLPDSIWLSENNLLNEVVVIPDSSLKVLLRKAYNNIEKNYTQTPTYLTGFYREVFENQTAKRFNYFSESFWKVYTPPYTLQGAEYTGQLKLIKSRTIKHPTFQKDITRYIGGPFLPLYSNKVLKRANGINPKYFKEYLYELEKITTYQGREVYIINYQNRDSTTKTKVFVDKQSLAYIKFEVERRQKRDMASFKQSHTKEELLFENQNNTWFLKHDKLEMYGTVGEESAKILLEFVTNKFEQDSVVPFAYKEQFLMTDIIADQTNDFSDSFFEGYDMSLERTNGLKNQINLAFDVNLLDSLKRGKEDGVEEKIRKDFSIAQKLKIVNLLLRLTSGIGVTFAPVTSNNAPFLLELTEILPEKISLFSNTKASNVPLVSLFNLTFKLTRRWHLRYQNQSSILSSTRIKAREFGVAYRLIVNNAKKPIFIDPRVLYSSFEYGVNVGSFKNTLKRFEVNGEKFNANNIKARLLEQNRGIKVGLSISTFSRRLSKLFVHVDYFLSLQTRTPYVQIQEMSFWGYLWGSNHRVNIPLNDKHVTIKSTQISQLPTLRKPWWIGVTWQRAI